NGVELDRAVIPGGDGIGVTRIRVVEIAEGDVIDLALTPTGPNDNRSDGSDGSANWLRVTGDLPDTDGDGFHDGIDNCWEIGNGGQEDGDDDGVGNVCDNCPDNANTDQADLDQNGMGDACDDVDGDGTIDTEDNCIDIANADQADADEDALGDVCDNCPATANGNQEDGDGNGIGDACDLEVLAHSRDDWPATDEQGVNNWYNGYYNLSFDEDGEYSGDDFIEFDPIEHWRGTGWRLAPSNAPWTWITAEQSHPNGINNGEEHWTVRRWVCDRDARLSVTWHTREVNVNGTGVSGHLFQNETRLDSIMIPGGDSVGTTRTVVVDAEEGDTFDIALSPVGLCGDAVDGSDGSANWLQISLAADGMEATGPLETLADSERDWSLDGFQGDGDWFYGYYDQRADVELDDGVYGPDDFVEFDVAHWNGSKWDLVPDAAPWTELTCTGGHPAANGQGDPEVHWAIRRWIAASDAEVKISGYIFNPSAGGDGTVGRVFQNEEEIYSAVSNANRVRFELDISILQGDTIDFVIDPDGAGNLEAGGIGAVNDGADSTYFIVKIDEITGGQVVQPAVEDCENGVDDDLDGLVDCEDSDCARHNACQPEICGNGEDDDGDGLTDCDDSDCEAAEECQVVAGPVFYRADADDNGSVQLTDGIYILNFLFLGGAAPPCFDSADADDNGAVQLTDGIFILNFLFLGGGAPPAPGMPGMGACGPDPDGDVDGIGCDSYTQCE
ncbi:MAG: thrombospondin type 3 repeat-containing protein, partial [Planctomycetota bacterium]